MQRTCHKPLFLVFSTNASYALLRKTSAYLWAPVFISQLRFLPTQWESMNCFYSTKLKNNFLRKINNWSVQKLTFCTFILHFNIFSVAAGLEDLPQQWKLGSYGWVGASEPRPVLQSLRPSPHATQNANQLFPIWLSFNFFEWFSERQIAVVIFYV